MFTLLPRGLWRFAALIANVFQKFFLIQYLQKFHITHRKVVWLDHALDDLIPHKPEAVGCYMGFVNYWIRPMCYIMHRYGSLQGMKLTAEYVSYMIDLYRASYRVYSRVLTTTRRPAPVTRSEKLLQFWDPHYLCAPSLHIATIILTIGFYRMLFVREDFPKEEAGARNSELYERGLEIAESVLYVKQHSVNCIPAAIYMVTTLNPELKCGDFVKKFIGDLFKDAPDIATNDVEKIQAYILLLYDHLLSEREGRADWTEPVLNFIENYTPQSK